MKKSNQRLAQIRTLKELRAAQKMLRWEVELTEKSIRAQVGDLSSLFHFRSTPSEPVSLLNKVGNITELATTFYEGYKFVQTEITKLRNG